MKSQSSLYYNYVLVLINIIFSTMSQSQEHILIFGGNGFIGSEFTHSLIQSQPTNNYSITIVTRGNSYFDSGSRIIPFVQSISCDRDGDLEFCTELTELVQSTDHFKYVIDFSGYTAESIEKTIELFSESGKIGIYIYISTDSVYEVCRRPTGSRSSGSKESDSIRPEDENEIEELNDGDEYGNEKLQAEEALIKQRVSGGFPYLIVRLPDVIGPRDTTERIWTYIMWIQFYDFIKIPIPIPPSIRNQKCSFVHVKDVARSITHLLATVNAKDEIYNLGYEDTYTLEEFLLILTDLMGKRVQFNYEESKDSFHLFPSVTRGPVDVGKLKSTGFKAGDLKANLKETVDFYLEGFYKFKSERDDVVHQMTKSILPRDRKGEFLKFIEKMDGGGQADGVLFTTQRTEL